MDSLRQRLALYCGLVFAGLVLAALVLRPAPASLDNPAYDALVRAHSRKLAAQAVALDSARVALTEQQTTVTRTVTKYRAIRDTLNIHDTVQVKVFVAQADSTVRACSALAESCDVFRVRAESSLAGLALDRDRWKLAHDAQRPSGLRRAWDRVKVPLAFTAGLYVGAKAVR